ncbi:hypothetical protein AWENTII_005402 [Aspergillus wentii]
MLFFSFFKTLTNQTVTIELKNDIRIRGTLKSVDQYLNIKLDDVDVLDLDKYPHLSSVKNMFIRGSVVRYVMLPRSEVDVGLLEDATRRGECIEPVSRSYCRRICSDIFAAFWSCLRQPELAQLRSGEMLMRILLQRLPTKPERDDKHNRLAFYKYLPPLKQIDVIPFHDVMSLLFALNALST